MNTQGNVPAWVEQASRNITSLRSWDDLGPLLELAASRQFVLIGEATHGTHESHLLRAELTKRLITNHGFRAVYVEADRVDAMELDQAVRFLSHPQDPASVLARQCDWPSWMWSNKEVVEFARWLKDHNWSLPRSDRIGWYGLDRWPLWAATREILAWVKIQYPTLINAALDAPLVGQSMVPEEDLGTVAAYLTNRLNVERPDEAAWYYRAMMAGGPIAMGERSQHWLETILNRAHDERIVVWAHNTHIGDTDGIVMPDSWTSFGHLARREFGLGNVLIVGFAGGSGRVLAAPLRGAPMDVFDVPAPQTGSVEAILAEATTANHALVIPSGPWASALLPHRAIGAVYDGTNQIYIPAQIGTVYDALLWSGHTSPVDAIHFEAAQAGQMPTLRV